MTSWIADRNVHFEKGISLIETIKTPKIQFKNVRPLKQATFKDTSIVLGSAFWFCC